jgi:hypothetical protein
MADLNRIAAELVNRKLRAALPHLNEDELLDYAVHRLERLPGQHLLAWRDGYAHHAIAISPTEIIHNNGRPGRFFEGAVEKGTLWDMLWGAVEGVFRIREYHSWRFTTTDTIHRAYSRLGEPDYNLATNNCETFSSWATVDMHASDQVVARIERTFPPGYHLGNAWIDFKRKVLRGKAQPIVRCPPHRDILFHEWQPRQG